MRHQTISAFAPGKLILSGEHSVVYGYQAIAIAVDVGVWVHFQEHQGASICQSEDPLIRKAIGTFLPAEGVSMRFRSSLPIGRGMGSSAALSIAFIRALARWENRESTVEEEYQKGMALESFFHGTPSGLDHTVSSLGKGVLYRKADSRPEIQILPPFAGELVIIDSGSAGNTAAMVARVRSDYPQNRTLLKKMGEITNQIYDLISQSSLDLQKLGALFLDNQQLLKQLGVSTPIIDDIIEQVIALGAFGAKLSGSGGGGIVLALAEDSMQLCRDMTRLGYHCFVVQPFTHLTEEPQ